MKKLIFYFFPFFLNSVNAQGIYSEALQYVQNEYNVNSVISTKENIYRKNGIVHIFLDEDGNLLGCGVPTTALEGDKFQVHIIYDVTKGYDFTLESQGTYSPSLNIYGENTTPKSTVAKEMNRTKSLDEKSFAVIGPFTGTISLTIKRIQKDKSSVLLQASISLAKLYHVSISAGLFGTTLKDPENIDIFIMTNGDTTLLADNYSVRGLGAIMVTYYLKGRSFLFGPQGGLFSGERFGICFGTRLDKDQFKNFFLGTQFDFARGGSLSLGLHFGERNFVEGYNKFKYGEDKFSGTLDGRIRKEWSAGFYFGIHGSANIHPII